MAEMKEILSLSSWIIEKIALHDPREFDRTFLVGSSIKNLLERADQHTNLSYVLKKVFE